MKKWILVLLLLAAAASVARLFERRQEPQKEAPKETASEEESAMRAMYLEYGRREKRFMFAQENGGLMDIYIPEEALYNRKGEKISKEELTPGDIVEVYGNGMIQESYPAQYPGVRKMAVVDKGTEEEVQKYVDEIYEYFYTEPPASERPMLQLEYRNDMAAASTMGIFGENYDWTYLDYENEFHHAENDSGDVRAWAPVYEFELPDAVHAPGYKLSFSPEPDEVVLTAHGEEGEEEAEVTRQEDGFYAPKLSPDTLYQVTALWRDRPYANGTISYAFRTSKE